MGFVPALLSVQNVRTYLRLFAFYFTLFVLIPIVGMYFMWPYSAHSAFPIGSVLLGRTIDCGLAFIVTAAVARVAGNGESSGVPVATERVALSFLKSVWPPALFLFALGAVPFAIGALAGNVLFGLFTLPVMAFGINFGFSTFAFLGGAVVVAWYGQRQWLVWLAFASAVMMVLPKLSTLVYPEGRLIVIGVLFSWALIFWFCKLFLRSLLATAREIYS